MITLATLPQATAQEVFNQSALHLLNQGVKCLAENSSFRCVYRKGELKCAAGCFISDEEYTEEYKGQPWSALIIDELVPIEHEELIRKLQHVHDKGEVEDWKKLLVILALEEDLEYDIVSNFKK